MDTILKKNEAEVNESAAKGLLVIFGLVLLTCIFCWTGIFDIASDMAAALLAAAIITLVIPASLILKFRFYGNAMKYIIIVAAAIMAGAAYALFTFQAVIIFVVPTILAGFYMNKQLLYFSGIITTISIFLSHVITGFYLRQPWLEPFSGLGAIIRYGAIPRCLQYWACFLLILFLTDRYMHLLLHMNPQNEYGIQNAWDKPEVSDRSDFEALLQGLTERERSVFLLMIGGYTNMQIAEGIPFLPPTSNTSTKPTAGIRCRSCFGQRITMHASASPGRKSTWNG